MKKTSPESYLFKDFNFATKVDTRDPFCNSSNLLNIYYLFDLRSGIQSDLTLHPNLATAARAYAHAINAQGEGFLHKNADDFHCVEIKMNSEHQPQLCNIIPLRMILDANPIKPTKVANNV